jgi:biotin carboxylase
VRHLVFVAPHFLENTNRYVAAFAKLEGLTLSVVSEDPASAIPEALSERVDGHYQVRDVADSAQLATAIRFFQRARGQVDRLTGALEQLQLPMAEAREATDVPGMRPQIAKRFRDKDAMKQVLREAGVPVAKSALVTSVAELRAFIDQVGFPVIVKPQAGLGTRNTHRLETQADVAALPTPSEQQPWQAEEFVRAREHTCETVSIHGKTVWRSGTRYFPSPLEVLETPWVQYCVLLPLESAPTWTGFAETNEAALRALWGPNPEVTGTALTHMEWFLRDDGAMLVNEVGARPPGVHIMPMMGLAHGLDMVGAWAELIAFDRFTPRKRTNAAGAAFFRGQGAGDRIVRVEGVDRAIAAAGPSLVELRKPRVGQPRATGYEGEGFAIVKHASTEGAKAVLKALVEAVQIRYG